MPNILAYLMLAFWPIVTAILFKRLTLERAMIASMLAGYLFLPEAPAGFDLPALPPVAKTNIPAIACFIMAVSTHGLRGPILPHSVTGKVLILTFVFSPLMTALSNGDPVFFGIVGVPGLSVKDAVALVVQQFFLVLPFLLGRQYLASGRSQRDLTVALVIGGLVYSLLMLIEMRLSPQLNAWIYGYYQHSFGQTIRFGGFRPIVFLYHGIWVGFFTMMATVSAWALWRSDKSKHKILWLGVALYMTVIMVLAKSLGALIFGVLLIPMVVILGRVMQIKIAIVIGLLAIAYPIMKGADLVPTEALLNMANSIDPDRARSLDFRFSNENTLLDRAYERPIFGWGSWGRNHILDPVTGAILTVTDGRWIIVIGVFGWIGFLAEFGLLVLPLVLLWREAVAAREGDVSPFVAPMSLILAINIADMLPNATLTPLTWLMAGAMVGYAEQLKAQRLGQIRQDTESPAMPVKPARHGWQSIM